MFTYAAALSQAGVPAAMSQVGRRHMRTRLKSYSTLRDNSLLLFHTSPQIKEQKIAQSSNLSTSEFAILFLLLSVHQPSDRKSLKYVKINQEKHD